MEADLKYMTTIHTAISLDNLEKDAGTKSEGLN